MPAYFSDLKLSISARLTLWYGLSILILLSVFVIFLYTSFHVSLHRDFERQLEAEVVRLQEAVQVQEGIPVLSEQESENTTPRLTADATDTYVRLISNTGSEVRRSENLGKRHLQTPALPKETAAFEISAIWDVGPAHSHYSPILEAGGRTVAWLEVTRLESALHRELHRLRWLLALGILLASGIAVASGYGLARRALRPVATLTEEARKIQAQNLGHRLPDDFGVRDELSDLAGTLNQLLERLDGSFDRERQFRADAAHEMFTPLSALRSEIDVALRKPRDSNYYRGTLARVQTHVERLTGVVEQLLQLSRAEAGRPADVRKSEASEVARKLIERFQPVAEARAVRLASNLAPRVPAAVNAEHLEAVLENLLDNAIKYTAPAGTVTVSTRTDGIDAILTVSDTGVGFTNEEATRLFDRFYRSDAHGVREIRGSGLGLSISKAVLDVYGGRLEARSPGRNRGSTFEVHVPVEESAWTAA